MIINLTPIESSRLKTRYPIIDSLMFNQIIRFKVDKCKIIIGLKMVNKVLEINKLLDGIVQTLLQFVSIYQHCL